VTVDLDSPFTGPIVISSMPLRDAALAAVRARGWQPGEPAASDDDR
jgi:hypothetical protein